MNSTSEQDHITLRRTFERPHYPISNNLTKKSTKHFMGINQVTNFLVELKNEGMIQKGSFDKL